MDLTPQSDSRRMRRQAGAGLDKRPASKRLVGHSCEELTLREEIVGEESNSSIVEATIGECGRPSDRHTADGPYWDEAGSDSGGMLPLSNESTANSNTRTHRVNEQMIAEEYRRGVRVTFIGSVRSGSLEFLFGGKGKGVVRK